ncbi:hypothetical protein [Methanobrevibacter sp. DSM 116169]|uniref:hypothetical protein n=1 Tax=Methanobrevibacter sp. DSM 116169 TaxID=3242727 RepID=UPI0038FC80DC
MVKAIKWNYSFFEKLSDKYYNHLLNYDGILPLDIRFCLVSSTPNFSKDFSSRIYNESDLKDSYLRKKVELRELSQDKAFEKMFLEDIDFIKKFPEYEGMIDEIIEL